MRQYFADDSHRLFGRDLDCVDQPADFEPRILDRLAGLDGQLLSQLLGSFAAAVRQMLQHGLALPGGQAPHRPRRCRRRRNRLVQHLGIGQRHARRPLAGVLVRDFQIGVRLLRPIGEVIRITFWSIAKFPFEMAPIPTECGATAPCVELSRPIGASEVHMVKGAAGTIPKMRAVVLNRYE